MQLKSLAILAASVSALVVAGSGTAFADIYGGVDCGMTGYAGCHLGAGRNDPPQAPPPPQQPGSGGAGGDPTQPQSPVNCQYVRSDYQPPSKGTATAAYHPPRNTGTVRVMLAAYQPTSATQVQFAQQQPPPGQSGAWYVYQCSGNGWREGVYQLPVWIPDAPQQQAPTPQQLAQQAYSDLRLPAPQIHASPATTQLVNLPTWLWMDRGRWQPQTATASVPGVSVTATAAPQSVTWSMGDGSIITCQGAGSPFPAGDDPKASSPDCGYTYRQTSQGQPDNTYPVTATVHWTVTWSGAGQGGVFPDLTTTSNAAFAVAESQALNQTPQ